MRVGFVLRSAEIKPLFSDLFRSNQTIISGALLFLAGVHSRIPTSRTQGSCCPLVLKNLCLEHIMSTSLEHQEIRKPYRLSKTNRYELTLWTPHDRKRRNFSEKRSWFCVDQQDHHISASLKRAVGRRVSKHSLKSVRSRLEVCALQGGQNAQNIFPPRNFPTSTTTKCRHMFPKHKS